jgi:hypothetical protein
METQQKSNQVLALLKETENGVTHSRRADDGLHAFTVDVAGLAHTVCYPDEVVASRPAKDLAVVAAAVLSLLRADPAPARVIVRAGMFETMLRTAGPYSMPAPAPS